MRHAHWIAAFLVAAFAISAVDAHATTITRNGNVVVSDTYEGDTVGSAAVADVGTWVDVGFTTRPLGLVTDAASPGAFEGSQYAALGGDTNRSLGAEMTLVTGDQLRFESMVYVPTDMAAVNNSWQFLVFRTTPSLAFPVNFWSNDLSGTWSGAVANPNYTRGIWQKWEFDYTAGNSTASLTIDGVSSSVTAGDFTSGETYRLVMYTNPQDAVTTQLYMDTVPEPSAWLVMILGGGGLAAVVRRKRA